MQDDFQRRDNTDEEEQEGQRAGKKKKIFLIVLGMLVIMLAGGAFALQSGLLQNFLGDGTEEIVIKEPEFMCPVPEIVVNIADGGRGRFLSVKFYLGHDEPKLEEELEKRMPELRDAVLRILWEKNISEIESLEGKELLREEILAAVNAMLNKGKVRGVYFWHVMVQ